jgi:tRNA uridine 5-carboxymethylaminomethyl modification enzyme
MFTSRAEFRILLRQDNADERLTEISYGMGLAKEERLKVLENKNRGTKKLIKFLESKSVDPDDINPTLVSLGSAEIKQRVKIGSLISRPQVTISDMANKIEELNTIISELTDWREEIVASAEILLKYSGYIEREKALAEKLNRLDYLKIPSWIKYNEIRGLTMEARQKLEMLRPDTIAQARRISGISPADISVLLILIGR